MAALGKGELSISFSTRNVVVEPCKDSTQVLDKSVTLLTLFPQKTIHTIAGLGGYAEASEKTLVRENGFEQVIICCASDFYAEKLSYVL
jgi:hypothetical protein